MSKVVKDISTPSISEPSALVTDNSALQASDDGSYTYLNATLPVSAQGSAWTFTTRPLGPETTPTLAYELVNKAYVDGITGGFVVHTFKGNGVYIPCTNLDGCYLEVTGLTLGLVVLWRRKSGTSGDTIVDVNLNGVSLFSDPNNRPGINYSSGDGAWSYVTPDISTIPVGGIVTVDIDSVEGGSPEDIVVLLYRG